MTELLAMSMKDLDRLRVIHTALAGRLTWQEAAAHLKLSERQIGNLAARVRRDGAHGLVHRLRGRPSNHRVPLQLVQRAVALVSARIATSGRPSPRRSSGSAMASRCPSRRCGAA